MRRHRLAVRPNHPSRPGRVRAVAGVVVALLAVSACGDDDSTGGEVMTARDEFGVALVSAGADDSDERVTLPAPYEVGQHSTTTADMTIGIEIRSGVLGEEVVVGLVLVMTQEVTDVTDGVATVESRIDTVEITESPAGLDPDEFAAEFDGVLGEVVVGRYSETGVLIGEMELVNGDPLPEQMVELFEQSNTMALPSDPIAVGARWSSLDTIESEGIVVEGETFYELIELTDDRFVLEVTQDIPLDDRIDGADIRGSYEGSGTITGDRANPLHLEMDYEQTGEFTVTDGSDRATVTSTIDVRMTSD